jgi:hypothetical protein
MSESGKPRKRMAALAAGALLAGTAVAGVHGVVEAPENRDFSVEAAPAGYHDSSTQGHIEGG